ncbi:ankyrin repeat domain-containing protein 34B-like [Hoplias malabaricus]|uniref:ankyrin repeat domain-containing protein 34B-like n=1 Tax=Hoplias malabaricus TaxID=27720 RepID=UPI0034623ECF
MAETHEYLVDGSPLITAAQLGKLRLVRLLVEGGAHVNERNQRGETPLLAACRAMRGDQSGNTMLRLVRFLIKNQADPNVQDKAGRTALMYACMERAGAEVAAALISAGADPSMEDYAGASALVYAINSQEQDTIQVLLDACRAKGQDIIIIATDLSSDGATVTRRYLNVPPSPNTSPVSCMSPSDIELKTSSPNSEAEGENIFNFRASGKRGSRVGSPLPQESEIMNRQRLHSEPWLAIHNLAHLSRTYEETMRQEPMQEKEEEEGRNMFLVNQGEQTDGPKAAGHKQTSGKVISRSYVEKYILECPAIPERLQSRRNTLPALTGQNLLQLPTLSFNLSSSDTRLNDQPNSLTLPPVPNSRNLHQCSRSSSSLSLVPPEFNTMTKWKPQEQLSLRTQVRSGSFLPPLPGTSTPRRSCTGEQSAAPRPEEQKVHKQDGQRSRRPPRRHSMQLEQMRQEGSI